MKQFDLKYIAIAAFFSIFLFVSLTVSAQTSSSTFSSFPPTEALEKNTVSDPGMSFKVTRLYSGKDGLSHFEDLDVKATQPYIATATSTLVATPMASAVGFQLLSFPTKFTWGAHNPPAGARYLELIIQGSETFTAGDGTSRTLKAGDMMLFDDPTGLGHQVSGQNGKSLVIKLS